MIFNPRYPRFITGALFNAYKFKCIVAARRVGKTYNFVNWMLEELLANPNQGGLWVDTVQGNLDRYVDRYFKKILGEMWKDCKYDKGKKIFTLPNDSYIDLRSAQKPENIEGFGYFRGVLNEAGIILKGEKGKNLWHNSIAPMFKGKDSELVIGGTPKGKNEFFDMCQKENVLDTWKTFQFSIFDSPYWDPAEIRAIKEDPNIPEDVYEQEYLGKFVTVTSNVICKRTYKESWRDDDDKPYHIEHPFIQRQLHDDGYYFLSFDGGANTTHSAAILGYHNKRLARDILLKEFYNYSKNDDLREISMQVGDFCQAHQINIYDLKMYGDPAIANSGDDQFIVEILGKNPDCLSGLRDSDDPEAVNSYRNRKVKRLRLLARDIYTMASDNKPRVIILKDGDTKDSQGWGCPNLYNGLFNGQYRYEIKDIGGRSVLTDDLEQIAPITDIADAYTYYILATRYRDKKEQSSRLRYKVLR